MQRSIIQSSSRSCLNAANPPFSLTSRCTSDLTPQTIRRSFGNGKRKVKPQTRSLLNPRSREKRIAEAGNTALGEKYARNQYNKDYRERKEEKRDAKEKKEENKRTYEVAKIYRRAMKEPSVEAFKAMKDDWYMGSLAPKRDTGSRAGKLGTVEMGLHQLHALTETQVEDVKVRMGDNVFEAHDRVVVLEGRDRGKIGTILSIDKEKMSATVDGINSVAVHVPEYMRKHDSDTRTFRVLRRDVRLDQLKLVHPIKDPKTNILRDVILDRMDLKKVLVPALGEVAEIPAGTEDLTFVTEKDGEWTTEREKMNQKYELEDFKWKTFRYVPSTDMRSEIVDLSEKESGHDYDAKAYAVDTHAFSVDQDDYAHTVVEPPFPASVLKEITYRGRKEITRYSDDIEDAIRARAEAQLRKKFELGDRVRTPLQELKVELAKTQRAELKTRRKESGAVLGASRTEKNDLEPYSTNVDEGEDVMASPVAPLERQKPVTDVMILIGRAMARNYAKTPDALTGERRRLVEKVLAQEASMASEGKGVNV